MTARDVLRLAWRRGFRMASTDQRPFALAEVESAVPDLLAERVVAWDLRRRFGAGRIETDAGRVIWLDAPSPLRRMAGV